MTFKIEPDGSGQLCVFSDEPEVGGHVAVDALILDLVVYDHVHGHAYCVDPQKYALARLTPLEAEKLRYCERNRPRAEPDIFTGESHG